MRSATHITTALRRGQRLSFLMVLAMGSMAAAQSIDWSSVPLVEHQAYQAVKADGSSDYSSGFPIRLRGVVLNNNEDWLDPTAAFSSTPGDLGGQAEFYVQTTAAGDFGGTSAWMGQCSGNMSFISDPAKRYSDAAWYGELDRLQLCYPDTTLSSDQLVRAGDLVEIRARGGLSYAGKMNVNEKHQVASSFDFEVVLLQKNYGLPTPTELAISDLKDIADQIIFDSTRQSGGERYQSTLVTIENVRLATTSGWGTNADLMLTDAAGLTFPVHLGLNESFLSADAPTGYFNVTGIIDQLATNSGTNGYRLLAMNAGAFVAVPEPATLALLVTGLGMAILLYVARCRRSV